MASTILNRTPSSTGNRKKWTLSMWIKNSNLEGQGGSSYQRLYQADNDNEYFRFTESTGKLLWLTNNGSSGGFLTTRTFSDSNAWYHLVLRIDTTLGTAGDRSRLYVNGVEETVFDTENQVAQDYDTYSNCISKVMQFGGYSTSDQNFNGCMSHVHMCDGYSYAPTEFGETDSTTGEWKIKTSPSVSYGTNGFFILKDGNSVTDQSGQSNNLTVSGTLTKTEDCPSNVFCTFNSILPDATGDGRLTNGNTTISCVDTTWISRFGTIGFTSGKYYWELKVEALNASNGYAGAGIQCLDNAFGSGVGTSGNTNTQFTSNSASAGFEIDYRGGSNNNNMSGGSNLGDTGIDYSNGDILGFAVDMDNRALYMHKNGTYITVGGNVGVPTSGASKTGAIAIPTSVTTCSPAGAIYGANAIFNYNFGNGYFKTTAVSSAGTNASGIGIFEYDVPTGYTALSTKGLNE